MDNNWIFEECELLIRSINNSIKKFNSLLNEKYEGSNIDKDYVYEGINHSLKNINYSFDKLKPLISKYNLLDSENIMIIRNIESDLSLLMDQLWLSSAEIDFFDIRQKAFTLISDLDKYFSNLIVKSESKLINYKLEMIEEGFNQSQRINEDLRNQPTHHLYELAAQKNQDRADLFRNIFVILIVISLLVIWFCGVMKGYNKLDPYDYWSFKIAMIISSVTLITYFVKQSVSYQKMADQYRQMMLELEAFPIFVSSLSTEDESIKDLRKTLALKYFGREIYSKTAQDSDGLLPEQIKASRELTKVATDLVKVLGKDSIK